MTKQQYRTERDTMGEIAVPADALYRAQTQRAVANFPISGRGLERSQIRALGLVKAACARVNGQLGMLDPTLAKAIASAADEVAAGEHDSHFPVDVFQTGSGTSSNINANEVMGDMVKAGRTRLMDAQAREYHAQALARARQLGNRPGEGEPLCGLGHVATVTAERGLTWEFWKALEIYEELGVPSAVTVRAVMCHLAVVKMRKGAAPATNDRRPPTPRTRTPSERTGADVPTVTPPPAQPPDPAPASAYDLEKWLFSEPIRALWGLVYLVACLAAALARGSPPGEGERVRAKGLRRAQRINKLTSGSQLTLGR